MTRPPLLIGLTMILLFVGGSAAGAGVGWWLEKRHEELAIWLGASALPISFVASMTAWYGVAVVSLIIKLPALMFRRGTGPRPPAPAPADADTAAIPGSILFMPISALICAALGLVIAALTTASFVSCFLAMAALGFAFGWLTHRAALAGYLLPPEEV